MKREQPKETLMIAALFPNIYKSQSKNIAIGICEFLSNRGIKVVVEDEEAEEIGTPPLSSVPSEEITFSICLGGDGTILRLVHRHPDITAPILAINLGSLGFMADVPLIDIYPSLQDLIDGKYEVHERMMMNGCALNGKEFSAVNEVVVHRGGNPSLIDLVIHVDGNYLNTFSADGIIISTSTGSTAYSLAAGGPILTPDLEAFTLTPISPHTISNRPIVFMPENEIQIQYISENDPAEVMYDGYSHMSITTGEMFYIRKSNRKFRLVHLAHHDFFQTLRSKLGWVGKLRV